MKHVVAIQLHHFFAVFEIVQTDGADHCRDVGWIFIGAALFDWFMIDIPFEQLHFLLIEAFSFLIVDRLLEKPIIEEIDVRLPSGANLQRNHSDEE